MFVLYPLFFIQNLKCACFNMYLKTIITLVSICLKSYIIDLSNGLVVVLDYQLLAVCHLKNYCPSINWVNDTNY